MDGERFEMGAMPRRQLLKAIAVASFFLPGGGALAEPVSDRAATVTALAGETRRLYQDAAVGTAVADRLLAALGAGRFDGAATPDALASLLNAEIAAASGDGHFAVMPEMMMHAATVPPTPPHSETPPLSDEERRHLERVDYGLAAVEILPGNVGRIDLRQFYRPAAEVRARLAAAMAGLADSWAMIVDLSANVGGDPKTVAHFLSYFFDRPPFVVNRFRWRNLPVEEFRTTADPGGPRYGESRPLIVQVSRSTFSAAEEFAYDVQALRRGSIVGEVTGGGANHALPVAIPGGFTAFIPQARAENPVTGTNWERVGVRPDLPVAAAEAARAAHRLALQRVAAAGDPEKTRRASEVLATLG